MELIKAKHTDCIHLKSICEEAYSKSFFSHWNTGGLEWYLEREFSIERLAFDIKDENTEYYMVKHELETVGFIKIKKNAGETIGLENATELEKIYILPKCKGMGIGKLVVKAIIKKAKERGKEFLFLSVIDTNRSAIEFYKTLGFKFHSKTTLDLPYFKEELKGMDIMVKNLNVHLFHSCN